MTLKGLLVSFYITASAVAAVLGVLRTAGTSPVGVAVATVTGALVAVAATALVDLGSRIRAARRKARRDAARSGLVATRR